MTRRKLEDLNLLDDFLFGSMVNYPEIGEKFVRELLKTIFGREFGKLTVVPHKFKTRLRVLARDSGLQSRRTTHPNPCASLRSVYQMGD